jgi:hypothetical protein
MPRIRRPSRRRSLSEHSVSQKVTRIPGDVNAQELHHRLNGRSDKSFRQGMTHHIHEFYSEIPESETGFCPLLKSAYTQS